MIVEKFDGKIGFESTYKKGSSFYFSFVTKEIMENEIENQPVHFA